MPIKNQPKRLRAVPPQSNPSRSTPEVQPGVQRSGQFLKSSPEDQAQVPIVDLGDCAWISSEMEAQQAGLKFINGTGSDVRLTSLARLALLSRPTEGFCSTEEYLVRTALALVSKTDPEPVPEGFAPRGPNPAAHLFDEIALGWIRWVTFGDISIFTVIPEMRQNTNSIGADPALMADLVALHLWSLGLEALVRHRKVEAREAFEKSILIGEQFGSEYTAAIKWTLVANFTLARRTERSPEISK